MVSLLPRRAGEKVPQADEGARASHVARPLTRLFATLSGALSPLRGARDSRL